MKKFTLFFCFLAITITLMAQSVNVNDDYQVRSPGINRLMNNYSLNPIQNKYFVAKPSAGQDTKSFSAPTTGTFNAFMEWQMNNYHWPGMQVGILHNGELLWKNNYGMANIEQAKPVNDSSLFRLFSVSKTVVATAVMKLVEDGWMDLNTDINQYLPFIVKNPFYPSSIITPKMLLTHSASIADHYPGSGAQCSVFEYFGDPQVSLHDFLESHFVPHGLCYANSSYLNKLPGSFCTYSNPGASLAGYLVESVVDTGFSVYCNDSIFNLLDMPNSRWYYSELDTSDVAMIYTWNGSNLIPYGFRSWVDYPCAEVKSNVNELSNYLKMYLNYGMYNGNRILDSTTVELMTTVYDTIAIWGIPIGLIWWYSPPPYNIWWHDGARGALLFFNKEEKWGGVLVGNGGQYEDELATPLVEYAMRFSEFSISSLRTIDNDQDGILEYGETIELETGLSNNLLNDVENVTATLHCNDPCFQLLDSVAMLGSIAAGQSVLNQGQPFRFKVRGTQEPHPVSMDMEIQYNNNKTDIIHFQLYAGRADLLLVKDERDVYQSERFYLEVLDSLGYRTHYWDLAVNGIPDSTFLSGFPAVIWYTGYDEDNTISEACQVLLMNYLDQCGRLFMTGQNISDEIGNTFFSNYYLRANHVENTNSVEITGMNADPVSQGLHFTLNGGTGLWNQYSQSILLPVNGGISCFQYDGQDCAGVRPDNSYKNQTVFLGFGFEGITEWADRYTLMQRILEYFGVYVDIEEIIKADDDLSEIHLIPNPASQAVNISYTLSRSQDITIIVHNLLGKEVLKETSGHGQAGKKSINLKLQGLEAGIYIVSVQGEQERRTAKLVVSK